MWFIRSFQKTAGLDNHSDGTEFKRQDTEPMGNQAGPGGMTPTGLSDYQPAGNSKKPGEPEVVPKKQKLMQMIMGKIGARMDTAPAVATQLKYETDSDDYPQDLGYNAKEGRVRYRKYLRATKNKGETNG